MSIDWAKIALVVAVVVLVSGASVMALAGTSPQYVTMKDGSVCEIPWLGNAGQYSGSNYLGLDYDTCQLPGLNKFWELALGASCPEPGPRDGIPECDDGLVVGGTFSSPTYPCYEIKTGP